MSNSAAVQLAAVPPLNRDRPSAESVPAETALTPQRGAWHGFLTMVNKAPDSLKIPYALMGAIIIIVGLIGFMYTQSAAATKDIKDLQDRNAMADTRVEILTNKVLVLETSNKFAEQLEHQNATLNEILIQLKQRR